MAGLGGNDPYTPPPWATGLGGGSDMSGNAPVGAGGSSPSDMSGNTSSDMSGSSAFGTTYMGYGQPISGPWGPLGGLQSPQPAVGSWATPTTQPKRNYPTGTPTNWNTWTPDPVTQPGMGSPSYPAPTTIETMPQEPQRIGIRYGGNQNAPGGRGTIAGSMQDPGNYWSAHQNDAVAAGANTGDFAPGSGVAGKDPWMDPMHQYPGANGQRVYAPGYQAGADGSTVHWLGGQAPKNSPYEDMSGTGNVFSRGGPLPGFVQQANAKFGLTPPAQGAGKDAWDKYLGQLAYYMPDIEADFKARNPGQPNPWPSFLGPGPADSSPIF